MNILQALNDEFGISKNCAELSQGYWLITFGNLSDNQSDFAVIPFKNWKVCALGYVQTVNGGTAAESIYYGIPVCDLGAADSDYFGKYTENASYGAAGDMIIKDATGVLKEADSVTNAPTWNAGGGQFNVWQNKAGVVRVALSGGGALDAAPFVMVKVA